MTAKKMAAMWVRSLTYGVQTPFAAVRPDKKPCASMPNVTLKGHATALPATPARLKADVVTATRPNAPLRLAGRPIHPYPRTHPGNQSMSRLSADALLLLTALIWGTAFIAQKTATSDAGPLAFVGARFLIAGIVVAPLAVLERRRARAAVPPVNWMLAGACGACLAIGSILQQAGIATASATNAGFLTALYVVLTPLMVWLVSGARPRVIVVCASFVSLAGAWLLTGAGSPGALAPGDVEIALADVAWALGIACTAQFLARSPRPFLLCVAQDFATAAAALGSAAFFEPQALGGLVAVWPSLLYAGLVSSGLAFTFQVIAQQHAPPAEAALILSLEAVFAALAGAWLLGERLSAIAACGCALILLGVLLAEIGPGALRLAARPSAAPGGTPADATRRTR